MYPGIKKTNKKSDKKWIVIVLQTKAKIKQIL